MDVFQAGCGILIIMLKTVNIEPEVVSLLEKEQAKREVSFSRMVCIALREWVNSQAVEIGEREYICGACHQGFCDKCEQEDTVYTDPVGNMFTLRCVCDGKHENRQVAEEVVGCPV